MSIKRFISTASHFEKKTVKVLCRQTKAQCSQNVQFKWCQSNLLFLDFLQKVHWAPNCENKSAACYCSCHWGDKKLNKQWQSIPSTKQNCPTCKCTLLYIFKTKSKAQVKWKMFFFSGSKTPTKQCNYSSSSISYFVLMINLFSRS